MKLILKNLKQVEFEIFIESLKLTVKEFKKEIEKLYSFDSEQIKLIFNGTMLENDKTLEEYGVKEDNHIIMMNTKTKILKNESKSKPVDFQEKTKQIKPQIDPKNKPNISQILSDNLTIQVNSLIDMGFEPSQAEAAVKAANGRIDLALEYLYNGIPDNKPNNNKNRNNYIQKKRNRDDITKELKKQAGVIKMLCKDNKFRIFEILNNIKFNDPGLMRLITDYRNDFKRYLDSPITEEDKQNYEKIEAEADKIQQERKVKKEKAKKEKEEKEKEKKEKKEKEEKEKKEDENGEKTKDDKDGNNKNKKEISKEEKNENKMEEEKKEIKENKENKEDKESDISRKNMEDKQEKQEEKNDNRNNNIKVKKDDNMEIEENINESKQENSEKKDENEKKKEGAEEKVKEKNKQIEDNKKEEKPIENKENKDKEATNSKIENSGNNPLINQLTEEDKEAINRIKSLCNFSFQTVAEAFIVCNKNEELTANYLFENM